MWPQFVIVRGLNINTLPAALAAILLTIGLAPLPVPAAEFSALISDGLGRPVPGTTVQVFWIKRIDDDRTEMMPLAKAVSDTNGIATGNYDTASFPTNSGLAIALNKTGYAGYTTGPASEYVLKRQFQPEDVGRIARLSGTAQKNELRELLASEFDASKQNLADLVFAQSFALRSSLRSLVEDPKVTLAAGELLAYIGLPEDIRLLMQYAPSPKKDPAISRWAYRVASAMLEPGSERDWLFLKKCALNEFNDHWVDTAAIRTLRLNASARSLELLREVRKQDPFWTNEIDGAVAYINSHPPPLADRKLEVAAQKLAEALGVGVWMGNEPPRYNSQRDLALVDCNFTVGGQAFLVHTATFQKVGDLWKPLGVRETRQTLLPKGPQAAPKPAGK
jgi:hypothetical protein